MGICRGDKRWKLVVSDIFIGRQLHQVQQRLTLVDVGEQGHELGIGVLALHQSSNDALFGLYHLRNKGSKGSFVFSTFKRQDNIDTGDELVTGDARLVSKAQHFKLTLNITIYAHSYLISFNRALRNTAIVFVFFHCLIVRLLWSNPTFQNCLIFLRHRHKLLAIKVCLSLLIGRNLFLFTIINFCVRPLQTDCCSISSTVFACHFTEFLQRRECLFTRARINLHSELQVLGQVKVTSVTRPRRHFTLFELFANFHGNTCWENCSLDLRDKIDETVFVFRLIKCLCDHIRLFLGGCIMIFIFNFFVLF